MKLALFDETAFPKGHPKGPVSFNSLLMGGEPDSPENYRYILGRQEADFHIPRHRHPFEQIRLPLVGDMNLGEQGILHEGEIGYFPEGQTYGPQDDPLGDAKPGERLQLVLQFGGASGLGMSAGRRGGPASRRAPDEQGRAAGRERPAIKFPPPRYSNVVRLHLAPLNMPSVPPLAPGGRQSLRS